MRMREVDDKTYDLYTVVWSWEPNSEGECIWLDFEIYKLLGSAEANDGERAYNRKGSDYSPNPVYDLDEAQIEIKGFMKWDGCCQFTLEDPPAHLDSRHSLKAWLDVIDGVTAEAARRTGAIHEGWERE